MVYESYCSLEKKNRKKRIVPTFIRVYTVEHTGRLFCHVDCIWAEFKCWSGVKGSGTARASATATIYIYILIRHKAAITYKQTHKSTQTDRYTVWIKTHHYTRQLIQYIRINVALPVSRKPSNVCDPLLLLLLLLLFDERSRKFAAAKPLQAKLPRTLTTPSLLLISNTTSSLVVSWALNCTLMMLRYT